MKSTAGRPFVAAGAGNWHRGGEVICVTGGNAV